MHRPTLPTAGGGRRHVSGLIRTDRASHPITPAYPRGTGRLTLSSAGLLFSDRFFLGRGGWCGRSDGTRDLSRRSKPWDGEQFSSPFSLKQYRAL